MSNMPLEDFCGRFNVITKSTHRLGLVLPVVGFICCLPLAALAQGKMFVKRTMLSNGLVVLALEDHTVPSVAFYTYYRVGSRNERPGITGLSHLFEHMMFNGSAKYKPKQFDQLIEGGGGYSNAFTNYDSTEYQEEFSSATLDTVLRLEADRMRSLKLDSANLEQERGIVKEERRMRVDNSIEGAMAEILGNNAFVAHSYRWDVVGFMKDLDAIRLSDAQAYFKTYYAPNNAVVCVVGDFDTETLFGSMHKYFEDIPRSAPARPVVNAEPGQTGEKRILFHHAADLPAVTIGYKGISYRWPEEPAMNILAAILASGESSRLYKRMVYEKRIATSVSASNDSRYDPGLFTFYAQVQPGHNTAECEAEIYSLIAEVQKSGVSERELQKAKNGIKVGFVSQFKTNIGRAGQISEHEATRGDWNKLYDYIPKHDRVTAEDVKRVAGKFLIENHRTVVTLVPEKPATTGGAK